MTGDRWVLIGVKGAAYEVMLRKLVAKTGYRGRWVHNLNECAAAAAHQAYFCAFFDRRFFRDIQCTIHFPHPMFVILVVDSRDVGHAIALQAKGEIHDWLSAPIEPAQGASFFSRAKLYVRQATELNAVKTATAASIRSVANLLCTGKWAEAANQWIERVKDTSDAVLLVGESGSGKRLLGRLLHYSSARAGAPFVTIDCASDDPDELEREIFGEIPSRVRTTSRGPRSRPASPPTVRLGGPSSPAASSRRSSPSAGSRRIGSRRSNGRSPR